MLSGAIGVSSPGQLVLGAIFLPSLLPPGAVLPAPFGRTFIVPQNGLPWLGKKTPQSALNFSFDWSEEIGSDIIVSSEWQLESSDILAPLSSVNSAGNLASVLISGGLSENIYNVTNLITTRSGISLDATFKLLVESYNL